VSTEHEPQLTVWPICCMMAPTVCSRRQAGASQCLRLVKWRQPDVKGLKASRIPPYELYILVELESDAHSMRYWQARIVGAGRAVELSGRCARCRIQ
jgi:hypothetical protein